jgi:hypothetical protein
MLRNRQGFEPSHTSLPQNIPIRVKSSVSEYP